MLKMRNPIVFGPVEDAASILSPVGIAPVDSMKTRCVVLIPAAPVQEKIAEVAFVMGTGVAMVHVPNTIPLMLEPFPTVRVLEAFIGPGNEVISDERPMVIDDAVVVPTERGPPNVSRLFAEIKCPT